MGGGKIEPKLKTGKGSRFIVLHAGSEKRFVKDALLLFRSKNSAKGEYHDSMDHERFLKWFKEQLFPNIEDRSLIIMDNASYHSKMENSVPTNSNRKSEVIEWLVPITSPMTDQHQSQNCYSLLSVTKKTTVM